MSASQLALLGGTPIRSTPLAPHRTIDAAEEIAVQRVLRRGVLSDYHGTWGPRFLGGPEVQALEAEWAHYFGVPHAMAVNSATSGLYAAIGALQLGPDDEVIVTPTSMSASAVAPLIYGATPIFADIGPDFYIMTPETIAAAITPQTRAIIIVNLFGHPAQLDAICALAKRHHLAVIEDNAQAPGARYHNRYAGTWGDIGVFSLNCHKHIQAGEGGVCVTHDPVLAERLQLIRNHAEAVVEAKGDRDAFPLMGWNYRMTEVTAAIARCQLTKLPQILQQKRAAAAHLRAGIDGIPGLLPAQEAPEAEHVYYTFPLRIIAEAFGVSRDLFVRALQAEGIPCAPRYVKPLYQLPLFSHHRGRQSYQSGLCPVAESLYEQELCFLPWCAYDFDDIAVRDIAQAIHKVVEHRVALRTAAETKNL